jgi:hypothetical protein
MGSWPALPGFGVHRRQRLRHDRADIVDRLRPWRVSVAQRDFHRLEFRPRLGAD